MVLYMYCNIRAQVYMHTYMHTHSHTMHTHAHKYTRTYVHTWTHTYHSSCSFLGFTFPTVPDSRCWWAHNTITSQTNKPPTYVHVTYKRHYVILHSSNYTGLTQPVVQQQPITIDSPISLYHLVDINDINVRKCHRIIIGLNGIH